MITNFSIFEDNSIDNYFSWKVGDLVYCINDTYRSDNRHQILQKGKKYVIYMADKNVIDKNMETVIICVDSPEGYYIKDFRGKPILKYPTGGSNHDPAVGYTWGADRFTKNTNHPELRKLSTQRFDL